MPSVSTKQQRFMGAELARRRAGQPTRTKMTTSQLEDFAMKKSCEATEHMPKGGTLSPKGDLGDLRVREGQIAGGSKIKGTKAGQMGASALPVRNIQHPK